MEKNLKKKKKKLAFFTSKFNSAQHRHRRYSSNGCQIHGRMNKYLHTKFIE